MTGRPWPTARRAPRESRPSAASRPGSRSCTCRRCSRSVPRWRRRRSQLERLAVLRLAGGAPRARPGGGRLPGLDRAGLVVRGLHAEVKLHAPDPLERALLEHACAGLDVAHYAERGQLDGDDEQRRSQDQRLDVRSGLLRKDVEVEEARPVRPHKKKKKEEGAPPPHSTAAPAPGPAPTPAPRPTGRRGKKKKIS